MSSGDSPEGPKSPVEAQGAPQDPQQEGAPEGDPQQMELLRKEYLTRLERGIAPVRADLHRSLLQRSFNLDVYERLLEHPECRELAPEDHPAVGALYRKAEISSDVFHSLAEGEVAEVEAALGDGGLVDSWENPPEVEAALRRVNPEYVSSGKEFLTFLRNTHGRPADFRSWGLFENDGTLRALAAGFFPPRDKAKRQGYAANLRWLLDKTIPDDASRGQHFTVYGNYRDRMKNIVARAATTAEFYMILADQETPRAGAVAFNHMMKQVEQEYPDLTDWYLFRFGPITIVEPTAPGEDPFSAHDGENSASRNFFKRRGFNTCGELDVRRMTANGEVQQVAGRQARAEYPIVVVHPTWKCMHATAEDVRAGNRTEMVNLDYMAKIARSQRQS